MANFEAMAKSMVGVSVVVAVVRPISEKEISRQYILDQARNVLKKDVMLKAASSKSTTFLTLLQHAEEKHASVTGSS